MIKFETKGTWKNTLNFLHKAENLDLTNLHEYGAEGVRLLAAATPKDSGETANSWYYRIEKSSTGPTLSWYNSNVVDEWAVVAILIQYGHATVSGTYVQGRDYINPALKPLFEEIGNKIAKEVTTV